MSPEAFSNALTLVDVPLGRFPAYDLARDALVERALNGEDLYIYHPVGNQAVYNLWIDGAREDLREWPGLKEGAEHA